MAFSTQVPVRSFTEMFSKLSPVVDQIKEAGADTASKIAGRISTSRRGSTEASKTALPSKASSDPAFDTAPPPHLCAAVSDCLAELGLVAEMENRDLHRRIALAYLEKHPLALKMLTSRTELVNDLLHNRRLWVIRQLGHLSSDLDPYWLKKVEGRIARLGRTDYMDRDILPFRLGVIAWFKSDEGLRTLGQSDLCQRTDDGYGLLIKINGKIPSDREARHIFEQTHKLRNPRR